MLPEEYFLITNPLVQLSCPTKDPLLVQTYPTNNVSLPQRGNQRSSTKAISNLSLAVPYLHSPLSFFASHDTPSHERLPLCPNEDLHLHSSYGPGPHPSPRYFQYKFQYPSTLFYPALLLGRQDNGNGSGSISTSIINYGLLGGLIFGGSAAAADDGNSTSAAATSKCGMYTF